MGKLWDTLFGGKTPPESKDTKAPGEKPVPWRCDMVLRQVGSGKTADYPGYRSATVRTRWESRERDDSGLPAAVRETKEKTRVLPAKGFVVAGKLYASVKQLDPDRYGDGTWSRDIYGRQVLCVWERFPCFDSSDLLYENRFFRWFFLWEDGKLIRVQHTDERPTVTVTEDVTDIEDRCWQIMQQQGCFQ